MQLLIYNELCSEVKVSYLVTLPFMCHTAYMHVYVNIVNHATKVKLTSAPLAHSIQGSRLEWCSNGLTKTTGGLSKLSKPRQWTSLCTAPVQPLPVKMTESASEQFSDLRRMFLYPYIQANEKLRPVCGRCTKEIKKMLLVHTLKLDNVCRVMSINFELT